MTRCMSLSIKFNLNDSLYLKDPQESNLGKKIIEHSIILIDEIGFESFTFKKLALRIQSAEKSIYRYFDNKHLLLLFISSWYWEWVNYLIDINIINIRDANKKLEISIENIVRASSENPLNEYINEKVLHRVVINEGAKSYHTSYVDKENQSGLFLAYSILVERVAAIIREVNPNFPYATSLASNLFEMANNQIFFAQHLPKMTNLSCKNGGEEEDLIKMLNYFASKLLR